MIHNNQDSNITITSGSLIKWYNKTDSVINSISDLNYSNFWASGFHTPYISTREYVIRFMDTLPSLCPGFNKTDFPSLKISFKHDSIKYF